MRILCPQHPWGATVELGSLRVALTWTELAEPLVGSRVEAAAQLLGAVKAIAFPEPIGTLPAFQQEIADVHRDLYAEFGELYGESIGIKIERCLNVSEAEASLARTTRAQYAEDALAAIADCDVLVTPTLAFVAPPADSDELEIRDSVVRFTYPFDVLGWPTVALPCGPATDGLPASLQIAGRPGADDLVLAAAAALEAALSATVAP
jgi:Asp-tRNA(Asn)/Glu-tRNA(Gln) amidotransferase A subunit family amidase